MPEITVDWSKILTAIVLAGLMGFGGWLMANTVHKIDELDQDQEALLLAVKLFHSQVAPEDVLPTNAHNNFMPAFNTSGDEWAVCTGALDSDCSVKTDATMSGPDYSFCCNLLIKATQRAIYQINSGDPIGARDTLIGALRTLGI